MSAEQVLNAGTLSDVQIERLLNVPAGYGVKVLRLAELTAQDRSGSLMARVTAMFRRVFPQPSPAAKGPTSFVCTELASDIKPKRIQWLWPSRIPLGKLTIFSGNPDQGKSIVTLDVATRLTTGRDWPDSPNTNAPCEVLLIAGEDDPQDTIMPRLMAAGADLTKVHIVKNLTSFNPKTGDVEREREISLDKDMAALERSWIENPNIRLVVVDPVSNNLGSAGINKEQESRQLVLIPLKDLAARRSVAVLAVMHLNKNAEASGMHRVGGAMAFVGVARAVWLFAPDPETPEQHLMLRLKNNLSVIQSGLTYFIRPVPVQIEDSQENLPAIEWSGDTDVTADAALSEKPGRPPDAFERCKEWLEGYLSKGRKPSAEVEQAAEDAGIAAGTLKKAKQALGVQSRKVGDAWYYVPSECQEGPIN